MRDRRPHKRRIAVIEDAKSQQEWLSDARQEIKTYCDAILNVRSHIMRMPLYYPFDIMTLRKQCLDKLTAAIALMSARTTEFQNIEKLAGWCLSHPRVNSNNVDEKTDYLTFIPIVNDGQWEEWVSYLSNNLPADTALNKKIIVEDSIPPPDIQQLIDTYFYLEDKEQWNGLVTSKVIKFRDKFKVIYNEIIEIETGLKAKISEYHLNLILEKDKVKKQLVIIMNDLKNKIIDCLLPDQEIWTDQCEQLLEISLREIASGKTIEATALKLNKILERIQKITMKVQFRKARGEAKIEVINEVALLKEKIKNAEELKEYEKICNDIQNKFLDKITSVKTLVDIQVILDDVRKELNNIKSNIQNCMLPLNKRFYDKYERVALVIKKYESNINLSDFKKALYTIKRPSYEFSKEIINLNWTKLIAIEKELLLTIAEYKEQIRIDKIKSAKEYKIIVAFQQEIGKEIHRLKVKYPILKDPRLSILEDVYTGIEITLVDHLKKNHLPVVLLQNTLILINKNLSEDNLHTLTDCKLFGSIRNSFCAFMRTVLEPLYNYYKSITHTKYLPHFFANNTEVKITNLVDNFERKLGVFLQAAAAPASGCH